MSRFATEFTGGVSRRREIVEVAIDDSLEWFLGSRGALGCGNSSTTTSYLGSILIT